MPTKDKSKQRIPFGKNGIKDGNGKIIRTDHPTFGQAIKGILNSATPASLRNRGRKLDKSLDKQTGMKKGIRSLKKKP